MGKATAGLALLLPLALTAPAAERSVEASVELAMRPYAAWIGKLVEFTRGVEFDERDVERLVEHHQALRSLALLRHDGEDDETPQGFDAAVREALADPDYRAWAAANGLEPRQWLRKVVRLSTVVLLVVSEDFRAEEQEQQAEFAAMIEARCAEVDAEACRQMRQALAESRAMGEAVTRALSRLPPPSAAERELFERHAVELLDLLGDPTEDDDPFAYEGAYEEGDVEPEPDRP